MKSKFVIGLVGFLVGCGPDRDFEGKNIFGSQTTVGATSATVTTSTASGGSDSAWPQENLGYNIDQTLPDWLAWNGYQEGPITPGWSLLSIQEWYDPDASKSINAILVISSKYDCQACASEAKSLQSKIELWQSQNTGIKVIVLVTNSPTNGPPNTSAALQWKSQYNLIGAAVAVDPNFAFAVSSTFSTPLHTVVNPRNMKVVDVQEGVIDDYSPLEKTAEANK